MKNIKTDKRYLHVYNFVKSLICQDKELVIVGVGTMRSYLDSIGPLIATEIRKIYENVYGTKNKQIHALTLEKATEKINKKHKNSNILAIDAKIVNKANMVGDIACLDSPVFPGAGVGKYLPPIGTHRILVGTVYKEDSYLLDDQELFNTFDKSLNYFEKEYYIENIETCKNIIIQAITDAIMEDY